MSATTNVPQIVFSNAGPVAPAESTILTGVQADLQAAFGGQLNQSTSTGGPTNATPQEQFSNSLTAIVGDKDGQMLGLAAQFDPATSSGRFQDALGYIYFLTRMPAEPTVATVTCAGAVGVNIPLGAAIMAADGNLYLAQAPGIITSMGTVAIPFACATTGPIVCPAQTFTIYQSIPGWDSAASSAAGVIGAVVESRWAFEERRKHSVAQNALGTIPAILGAVLSVPGVLDAYVTDNATNAPVTTGGVTLAANSLYVCVAGGDPQAIANAIWTKKAPGCGYTGNTTRTVLDQNSGYTAPYPSYSVTFQTAASTPVYFAVTLANSAAVPSTALTQIQNAIIAAFAGGDGGPRARIGSTLYASRYYAPVAALGSWVRIIAVQVGLTAPGALNDVVMNINQIPSIAAGNITLTLV